jgi:hypothetical protein
VRCGMRGIGSSDINSRGSRRARFVASSPHAQDDSPTLVVSSTPWPICDAWKRGVERSIAEALRQVWSARGAADLVAVDVSLTSERSPPQSSPLDSGLESQRARTVTATWERRGTEATVVLRAFRTTAAGASVCWFVRPRRVPSGRHSGH